MRAVQRRIQLACHVSRDVSVAFTARAKSRELTVAALLRQCALNELYGAAFDTRQHRDHILFIAIAVDGLLGANPDPDLRPRLIEIWKERVAREDQSHAA